MLFIGILFAVGLLIGVGLLVYANKYQPKIVEDNYNSFKPEEKVSHMDEVFNIEKIHEGIIYQGNQYLLLTKIEGINLSAMSEGEQNARESALISVLAGLDYPIRFITNTAVIDTSKEAQLVAGIASATPEGNLRTYRTLYAGALEQMRVERSVLTQQTFLVVSGSTIEEARRRVELLNSSLANQTSMVVTPLKTTDAVYDAIQSILMPEKIIKPSDIASEGVLEPVHFHTKEVVSFVQEKQIAIQA